MRLTQLLFALVLALGSVAATANDYVVSVSGFVCEFCALGVSKKVSKLPFIDRDRYSNGIEMDSENQLVTLAVKQGSTLDPVALNDAVTAAGYNVEEIYVITQTGEREVWQP